MTPENQSKIVQSLGNEKDLLLTELLLDENTVQQIISGFDELITGFNEIPADSPILDAMSNANSLKEKLGGSALPKFEEIDPECIKQGINTAIELMKNGIDFKGSEEEKKNVILVLTINTNIYAKTVGAIGHIIERSLFEHFKQYTWKKDEILEALDETAVLVQYEYMIGKRQEGPLLYKVITSDSSTDENGGLGWMKWFNIEKQIEEMLVIKYPIVFHSIPNKLLTIP